MSFDYKKGKRHIEHGSDSMWTSYSDLFLMLSIVFLLLYVTASLKTQTSSLQKNVEYQKLQAKAADLEQQIQVYNTLKDETLKQSNDREQQVYDNLMKKLTLLKEEAKDEKEDLRKQATENEQKEAALNEYQQMIRNIINSNILAKSKIKNREQLIVNKEVKLGEQRTVIANKNVELQHNQEEIGSLNHEIESKQRNLAANRALIKDIHSRLKGKISELTREQKAAHTSREALSRKIANLKKDSERKVSELESKNKGFANDLTQATQNLKQAQASLGQAREETSAVKQQYSAEMSRLKSDHEKKMGEERAAFEANLKKEHATGEERAKKIAEFAKQSKQREAELAGKLGQLEAKSAATEKQLGQAEAEKGRALANVEGLQKEKAGLQTELKHSQEVANARKLLAKRIQGELKKAGLHGTVDEKTGDVTLAFGEEYFDTGSANLKPTMQKTLERFVPGYSRSLFKDDKIAEQIDNVEIVGFASSTYKGRYVAPGSLRPEDQDAVNFNLKLSFNRANAIFKYIFDTKRMKFEHQQELLPKIKVVGRGYLPDGKSADDFRAGMPEAEFCSKYKCKSAQKVIIKFKLKD